MAPEQVQQLDPEADKSFIERYLPIIGLMRDYSPNAALRDGVAALVLAVLLFPQAMAYALLAGLPPQIGLYAAVAPALVYALFGSSRYLSIGPVALVSLLVADAVASASEATGVEPTQVALALAAMTGAILVVAGILGLGVATDFLGKPVLDGFAAGAALLIASSQLRHFLGMDIERAGGLPERLGQLFSSIGEVNMPTLALGGACLVLLLLANRFAEPLLERMGVGETWRQPIARSAPFAILALATAATALLALRGLGVETVGATEVGMPPIGLPPLGLELLKTLLPSALVIALVSFVIGIAIAESLTRDDQSILPRQELLALGASNLASSLTGGYPIGASVSRSAVARGAGGSTPLVAAIGGLLALLAGWGAGSLLEELPKAALSALIMVAAIGLLDVKAIKTTWRYDRSDALVLLTTFAAVLMLGVVKGLLIGATAGLVQYLMRTSRPRVVVVGRDDRSNRFHSEDRDGVDIAQTVPVLVLRIDESLFFANARHVRDQVIEEVVRNPELNCLLLDMRSVNQIDITATEMLRDLQRDLAEAGVTLALGEMLLPVIEKLRTAGLLDQVGDDNLFLEMDDALQQLEDRCRANSSC